ncbi:protein of unknown function [Aquiflexum balticum DSM 16537]|uniref:AsmA-like C-terminal region n=1 Tax=Aquiflexum balticum DSM 16537 TaxID=758820 RepID=A0A1W2GZD1_9BACT|nr:DUF748 domain-containing protein [Aquiflexum balticum]SMD42065.1 protein of unknown function [Aquiflexum balticum DSM 16537]
MKKFLIGLSVLIVLVVLVMRGIPYLINLYLNDNADRIVTNMITRTSDFGNHEVSFGEIKLNYNYSGTFLKIKNIKVSPSDSLDDKTVKVNLVADQINVTGFKWFPFLFQNTLSIDSALLDNIHIISSGPPIDSLFNEPRKPKSKKNKDYDLIEVENFELKNFSFEVENNLYDSIRMSLINMNVQLKTFQLTKEDLNDPKSLFHLGMAYGSIEEAEFHFDKFRQSIKVKDIELDTRQKSMNFGYLGLLNKLDKFVYTSLFKERQGWLQIDNAELQMRGVNFGNYFRNGVVEIDSIYANNFHLEVFTDKRIPEDFQKRPQMIHQIFKNLKQFFHVEHLLIDNAYIKIEEKPDNKSPRTGHIFFSDLNAHITNVSNYIERRGTNRTISIEAAAKLMGEGPLNATIKYDLEDPEGKFTLKGTLGRMDIRKLNTMIEPEAKASLKSGTIDRLDFNILANDFDGSGELIIRYRGLEIELLNRDFQHDQNLIRKVGSFLANKVIIKSNNPKTNGELVKGNVYFIRIPNKSMFNYWWQLIFSGLKSTITGDDIEEMRKKELAKRAKAKDSKEAATPKKDSENKKSMTNKEKRQARKEKKESN